MAVKHDSSFVLTLPHHIRTMRQKKLLVSAVARVNQFFRLHNLNKLLPHPQVTDIVMISKDKMLPTF